MSGWLDAEGLDGGLNVDRCRELRRDAYRTAAYLARCEMLDAIREELDRPRLNRRLLDYALAKAEDALKAEAVSVRNLAERLPKEAED